MRRIGFFIWLLTFCFVLPALAEEDTLSKSRIELAESLFNFGNVSQGTVVKHDFVVKNSGESDLVIHRIVPACGCTATSASADTIPPNGEGTVHVEFDTTGFSGTKHKTVRLYTNDLNNPTSVLTLKGDIEPDVDVEPKRLFFGDLVRGLKDESRTHDVTIRVREDASASIGKITSYSRYLSVKEVESGPRKKVVRVTVSPEAPLGELRERLIVGLDGSKRKSINVPVFASVKGTLKLDPRTISFGIIEGQESFTRKATLKNLGESPVKIKSVDSSDDAVTAEVTTIKPGKVYVINISVDPAKVERDLRASLSIVTDSQDEEELSLSVYGVLPPKRTSS